MDLLRFSRALAYLAVLVAPLGVLSAGGCSSVVTSDVPSGACDASCPECCNDAGCPGTAPTSQATCALPSGVHCSYYADASSCPEVWACLEGGSWFPQPAPYDGDICPVAGVSCGYGDGCSSYTATCESTGEGSNRWVGTSTDDPCCYEGCYDCTYLYCGDVKPEPGSYCDWDYLCFDSPTSCTFVNACGTQELIAVCEPEGWLIEDPCDCYAQGDLEACEANPLCEWRVPGCGEKPLTFAGCFPAEPCFDTATCPVGWGCGTASTGCPPGDECDTCDNPIDLCQPPPPP